MMERYAKDFQRSATDGHVIQTLVQYPISETRDVTLQSDAVAEWAVRQGLGIGQTGFEPGWGCGDNNCAQFHPDQDGGNATKHDVNQVACYMQGRLDSNGSPDCTAAIGRSLGQPPVFELQTVQAETENCTTASSQPSCVPATHTCSADRTNSDVFLAQRFFPYYGDADAGNETGGGSVGEKKAGMGVTTLEMYHTDLDSVLGKHELALSLRNWREGRSLGFSQTHFWSHFGCK